MNDVDLSCSTCGKKLSKRGVHKIPALSYHFCKKCKMEFIDKNLIGEKGSEFINAHRSV